MSATAGSGAERSSGRSAGRGIPVWPALFAVFAAFLVGLLPTLDYLMPRWLETHGYSHGLLIVAICLWLVWDARKKIAETVPQRSGLALFALAGLIFGWTLSHAASVEIGVEMLWPAALWLAAASLLGLRGAWKLAFPIGFLYFAIPLWDLINKLLQETTTDVVSVLLPIVGVPAYIEGNYVQIPAGRFEIAGGCSGLHFFVVGLALAALYGYLYYPRWSQRLKLLAVAAVMTLVLNWVRVTTIITAGHLTDMQSYLVQVDHYTFGWVLFGVMLIPFYWLARRFEGGAGVTRSPANGNSSRKGGEDGVRGESLAAARDKDSVSAATRGVSGPWLIMTLALLVAPILFWARPLPSSEMPVLALPDLAGWQGPMEAASGWSPTFNKADVVSHSAYERDGHQVEVYMNWYASQTQGREVVGYGNRVEGDWTARHTGGRKLELDRGGALGVQEIIVAPRDGAPRLVWYWYQIGDKAETSPVRAKLIGAWQALQGQRGAGLIAVSAACVSDCEGAREALASLLHNAGAPIRATLLAAADTAAKD